MLNPALHKTVLLKILKNIYKDTTLGPLLGFKGGTAVYLFYDLPRFSVDLDFDLLDETKSQGVFDSLHTILLQYGDLKDTMQKKHTLFFELSYGSLDQNIKVEVNRRSFGSKYELQSYLGIPMLVMVREDIFAHKLVALFEREAKAHRDIYDVWFFLNHHWPVHREMVEKRTGLPFTDFLQKCIALIEKKSDQKILDGIGELLDVKQKAWVKAHLRTETLFLLQVLLENTRKDA